MRSSLYRHSIRSAEPFYSFTFTTLVQKIVNIASQRLGFVLDRTVRKSAQGGKQLRVVPHGYLHETLCEVFIVCRDAHDADKGLKEVDEAQVHEDVGLVHHGECGPLEKAMAQLGRGRLGNREEVGELGVGDCVKTESCQGREEPEEPALGEAGLAEGGAEFLGRQGGVGGSGAESDDEGEDRTVEQDEPPEFVV